MFRKVLDINCYMVLLKNVLKFLNVQINVYGPLRAIAKLIISNANILVKCFISDKKKDVYFMIDRVKQTIYKIFYYYRDIR